MQNKNKVKNKFIYIIDTYIIYIYVLIRTYIYIYIIYHV